MIRPFPRPFQDPLSGSARPLASRLSSREALWVTAVTALALFVPFARPISPADYFWQLAHGRWIMAHRAIPEVDVFSFTAEGRPFLDQPWLAQLAMLVIERAGGATLQLFIHATAGAAAVWILVLGVPSARHLPVRAALAALVLIPSLAPALSIRSQTLALPLASTCLVCIHRALIAPIGSGRRIHEAIGFVVALVVWANVHGSFPIPLLWLGCATAGAALTPGRVRRANVGAASYARALLPPATWLLIAGVASGLTPHGFGVWGYATSLAGNPFVTSLSVEWKSLGQLLASPIPARVIVGSVVTVAYFGLTIALLIWLGLRVPGRVSSAEWLMIATLGLLTVWGVRFVVWFCLTASATLLAHWPKDLAPPTSPPQRTRWVNAVLIVGLISLTFSLCPWIKPLLPWPPSIRELNSAQTPVDIVDRMRISPWTTRRVLCDVATGSYLTWALPEAKVFFDARMELYPDAVWHALALAFDRGQIDEALARFPFDSALLDRDREVGLPGLVATLRRDPRFVLEHEDHRFSLFRVPSQQMPAATGASATLSGAATAASNNDPYGERKSPPGHWRTRDAADETRRARSEGGVPLP